MAGIRLEWAQFGDFDSFDVLRSNSPMDINSLPSPIATNLPTMYYVDTTVVEGATYYYRVVAWRDAAGKVSGEIELKALSFFDEHWDKVVALLHFDGDLTDEKGVVWGKSGSTTVSGAQAKFGGYSLSMPVGYGGLMSSGISADDRNWRASDFTIECFVYCTEFKQDFVARPLFILDSVASPGITNWQFGPILGGKLCFSYWAGSVIRFETATSKLNLNQWHHIALAHVKDNNKIKLFVDGVLEGEFNVTVEPQIYPTTGIMIGLQGSDSEDGKTRGFVDEFRITKGVARYTENFTPPDAPFPSQ